MSKMKFKINALNLAIGLALIAPFAVPNTADAVIAASHVYHNHMPNFWPYYDTATYASTAVGGKIRYMYDGQVINLQAAPPANYTYFLASGAPMPHDALASTTYYDCDAKRGAYTVWPAQTARANNGKHPLSQTQVTMSAAVVTNVQSFAELGLLGFQSGWASDWQSTVGSVKTTNGFNALEPIHFTGHHSMGPLVGPQYFLKDLIYQNVTLQQDFFLGNKFTSSKGFFPTELGFSERLIPTLKKLGIEWSVMGNNHFSRALRDYPYNYKNPAFDTLVSPPNRADLQNTFEKGGWEAIGMAHEQQTVINKFPFANIPHWVQYVDPESGEVSKIAGIPVDQNGSWLEGWEGMATPKESNLFDYEADAGDRTMYFVIAHDGDNSSGRAGSISTWLASSDEYSTDGVVGMGIQEYLKAYPIPADDVQHVQDGSWIDTRDSSSDPTWYHWHIPMGVWLGQLDDFNKVHNSDYEVPVNFEGQKFQHAVSMEYGYHYLERNFALLQAAINYAETAEQIWLDAHPNYWSPSTDAEKQVTYEGNQLNPYMMSYPVKGDEANDYKGGANPAELGWYFLISSIDSGFGYYDENQDDNVKPTLGFNNSLFFTEPYVQKNLAKDKTGPSMWWVQRYPYNPGSANASKAEGWKTAYADNEFVIYTYAYDVSGIKDVKVMIRPHKDKSMSPTDIAPRVYDPKKFAGQANVDVNQVGEWKAYPTQMRDLTPDIDGVDWQTGAAALLQKVVQAKKIGNTYYTYISDYRDQLIDYYMEATDNLGNVTKSEIQSVYVGAGRYNKTSDGYIEDVNGEIEGLHMFFTDRPVVHYKTVTVYAKPTDSAVGSVFADYKDQGADSWNSAAMTKISNTDYYKTTLKYVQESGCADVKIRNGGSSSAYPSDSGKCLSEGAYTIDEGGNFVAGAPDINQIATVYFKPSKDLTKACMHYRGTPDPEDTGWTKAPGTEMTLAQDGWFKLDLEFDADKKGMEFLFNDCGSTWYKNAQGGNFVADSIADYSVDDTKLTEGSPFEDNKSPIANVTSSAVTIKKGESVTLDASSSRDPDGTIVKYQWSTGETTAKITVSPEKTTDYSVVVTDDDGATASRSVTVTVDDDIPVVNKAPSAVINASSTTITAGDSVTLDGSASKDSDGSIASYSWKSADGKVVSTSAKATVTPASTTTYTLTVVDNQGAENTATVTITVNDNPLPPVVNADFTVVKNALNVTLTASTTSDIANASYNWNFGDGTNGEGKTVSHSYKDAGTYDVTLVVTDGSDKISASKSVVVTGVTITDVVKANIVASALKIDAGDSVTLDASSSKSAVSYLWNSGETTARITVAPQETKEYCVTVSDSKNSSDTSCVTIEVNQGQVPSDNHAPKAVVISDRLNNRIEQGQSIKLDASKSSDPDGDDISFLWSNGQSVNEITVSPSETTVYTVTVTDAKGASDVASVRVEVIQPNVDNAPVAVITPRELNVSRGKSVTFYGVESYDDNGIVSYQWSVDGVVQAQNGNSFKYTADTAGEHSIELTVSDKAGHSSSAVSYVTVINDTVSDISADFIFNGDRVIRPGTKIHFDAGKSHTSDGNGIISYTWWVNGNRQSADGSSMSFEFSVAGINNIKLVVKDAQGNESTKVIDLPVALAPNAVVEDEDTGLRVTVAPEFEASASDANDTKNSVTQDNPNNTALKVRTNTSMEIKPSNLVNLVRYYVYKKAGTGLTAAVSDSDKLCYFVNYDIPDCNATSGDEYLEVDASEPASIILTSNGDYVVQMVGTDKESNTLSVSEVPVVVSNAQSIDNGNNDNNSNNDSGKSGGSGGGAFDPLSLIMLGGLAALMRRRKVAKAK